MEPVVVARMSAGDLWIAVVRSDFENRKYLDLDIDAEAKAEPLKQVRMNL